MFKTLKKINFKRIKNFSEIMIMKKIHSVNLFSKDCLILFFILNKIDRIADFKNLVADELERYKFE